MLEALDDRYPLNEACRRAGINQRQLARIRQSEQADFAIRLRLKYHRRLRLKGGDAAMHRVVDAEACKPWSQRREWPEIKAEIDRYRSMYAEAPLWVNTDEPAPIPPDPEGIF